LEGFPSGEEEEKRFSLLWLMDTGKENEKRVLSFI
jgi:hypothetical protein